MTNLDQKVGIVTGGASGIGRATVEAFVAKGMKVVIADFNEQLGKEVEQTLRDQGAEVLFVQVDVGSEASVAQLVAKTVEHFGQLDVIFNNAGIGGLGELHELTYEDYEQIVKVNQDGVFFGMKHAIQAFLQTGGGVIINTASILGVVSDPGAFAYTATKGAVVQMTKSAALQYATRGIRVNAVAPGYIESGMVNKEALGEFYDGLVAKHPVQRLGKPEEIAHAVVFLAENDFTTGTTLLVDGGYTSQ